MSLDQFPQAERLATEDAILDTGQLHREPWQINLADDVLELVHVHPRVLHPAQGYV